MRRLVLLSLLAAAVAIGLLTSGSQAATPASQTVTAPTTAGDSVTVQWDGTIPNLSDGVGTSSCKDRLTGVDREAIRINVPAGAYDSVDIDYKFTIAWDDAGNDEGLTVINKDVEDQGSGGEEEGNQSSEVGSSDGSAPTEQVVGANLPSATYEAQACPYLATTPQDYHGTLVITAKAKEADKPAADAQGLSFSASV